MKKTLVLVVDRDDDFGVKGKVNTPVIGVQNCLDAATAFGIADPEDSDLNALYAAVSVCLELQEDGKQADVALICGDEKVGHRSDLALVSQLTEVLEEIDPDSVVLVGDGAEDEYIYPIISSRAHVDSVRKVYVKQAPGLEGTFYILTKMMSDPDKRKRFLVPLGFVMVILSLFFLIPGVISFAVKGDVDILSTISGPLAFFFIGAIIMAYGYNIVERFYDLRKTVVGSLIGKTTSIIFLCLSVTIVIIMGVYSWIEIGNLYLRSDLVKGFYFISAMIWPVIIAIVMYELGTIIERLMDSRELGLSPLYGTIGLASLGLVASGIFDIGLSNMGFQYSVNLGIAEIVLGVALSIFNNFVKARLKMLDPEEPSDETA